ncbi:MAG: hypothetical protein GY719_24905 [bacterium]|nr:hypothetical protein [bacterium]
MPCLKCFERKGRRIVKMEHFTGARHVEPCYPFALRRIYLCPECGYQMQTIERVTMQQLVRAAGLDFPPLSEGRLLIDLAKKGYRGQGDGDEDGEPDEGGQEDPGEA